MNKRTQWFLLFATSMVSFMSTIDASSVNIAVPKIAREMRIPMNQAEWVVSVYLILICVLLIFFGKLSDQIGRFGIFQWGTLVFVAGSLLCGLSINLPMLLACRVLQGVGASMVMATNFGIITEIFPLSEYGRALGINTSFVQVGNIAGPGLGGWILSIANWHWIFYINVPIGIVAFLLGHYLFPKQALNLDKIKVDRLGYGLFAGAVLAFFIGIYWGQVVGFVYPGVIILMILAGIFIACFIHTEKRVKEPLIELKIFRSKGFCIGIITAMLVYMCGFFNNVLMPFYLQETLMFPSATAGLIMMSVPLVNVFSAPIGGILADHIGAERVSFYALFFFLIPEVIFMFVNPKWSIVWVIIALAFYGLANGAFQNNPMIMGNAAPKYQGIAGSIAALARNFGMAIGLSMATTLLYFGVGLKAGRRFTAYPHGHGDWFVFGMHFSYSFALGLIVIAIILVGDLLRTMSQTVKGN